MLHGAALKQTGTGWEFASEEALENFLEENLQELLGLTFLKRQHNVKNQLCDLLAVGKNRQLLVLELKNTEDRYIVQQLTRYYDALLEEKTFQEQVDYDRVVELVAIAPSFHRDNLIDIKYHTLNFQLIQFSIIKNGNIFYLELNFVNERKTVQVEISYQEIDFSLLSENITEPPRLLLDWLGACTRDEQEGLIEIRQQILTFHSRMQEMIESKSKSIMYGTGKTKLCAEFCFDKKLGKPVLFLWLPLWRFREKEAIGRTKVWTDGKTVSYLGHVKEGIGKIKLMSEWESMPVKNRPRNYLSLTPIGIENYMRAINYEQSNLLKVVVDLALQKWLKKI